MPELKEYRVSVPLYQLQCDGLVFIVKATNIDEAIEMAYSGEYERVDAVYNEKSSG